MRDFDRAGLQLLSRTYDMVEQTPILQRIPETPGPVPGSKYWRQPLGTVVVHGFDNQPETSRIQRVRLEHVGEHPHDEEELYFGHGGTGVLTLGTAGEPYPLNRQLCHFIPSMQPHALVAHDEFSVLVYKFSRGLRTNYIDGVHHLELVVTPEYRVDGWPNPTS